MDRNEYMQVGTGILNVALRKESVDRNIKVTGNTPAAAPSLSVRRAWIEILLKRCLQMRNRSLSVRRAWIEIPCTELYQQR